MSVQPILPIAGVPDELIRVLNDRLRSLDTADVSAVATTSTALPNVGAPGRFVTGTTDAQGRVIQRGQLQISDLPGGGYPAAPVPTSITTQSPVTGSRAFATVYRNTGTTPMFVLITCTCAVGGGALLGQATVYTDSATPPVTPVTGTLAGGGAAMQHLAFWVLPGNYYRLVLGSATVLITYWVEWS